MHEDSDFFGEAFEYPDDDPLLGAEEGAFEASDSKETSSDKGPPSWMSEGQENGEASGSMSRTESGPPKKEVLIEQGSSKDGIQQINEAVGEGWKLVRISLGQANGGQVATQRNARRFVATLEQESPRSLFEFA